MDQIYQHDLEPILSTFASHRADVEWLVKKVIYGLFLSDHTLLSAIDAELVIVSAIWCQGLKGPTMWHLRGLRRFGGSLQDLEGVQTAVQLVAGWSGKDTTDWLKVNEVKEIQNL